MVGRCESCGRDDEQLVAVRRVYVMQGDADGSEIVEIVEDPESWCEVCMVHYPHQLV
ncbi:MAG: hypothetical protein ACKVWR_22240 [Acidimicrobiales bacterium]